MAASSQIFRVVPFTHLRSRVAPWLFTLLILLSITTGCSNVIRAGMMNSNTVFLDPSMSRTAYLQLRNTSENQNVTLSEIHNKLTSKGYQLTKDPDQANYWIQAKVVYCHKAAEGVTPESVTKANFGTGISSGGTTTASANSTNDDQEGDMKGMMAQVMAMSGERGGFPGMQMQQPPKEEDVTYLCVIDVQITDRKIGKPLSQPMTGQAASGLKVQHIRMVGYVRQKDLDILEATSIIQGKISTGIADLF